MCIITIRCFPKCEQAEYKRCLQLMIKNSKCWANEKKNTLEKHNKTEIYVQLSCTLNINGFKSFHNFSAMNHCLV